MTERLDSRAINEAGNIYGRLTVLKFVDSPKPNQHWLCQCECGRMHIAKGSELRRGKIQSCGCWNPRLKDEAGNRYGKLKVLSRALPKSYSDIPGRAYWACQCDCGEKTVVRGTHLRTGRIASCGCCRGSRLPPGQASFNRILGGYHRAAKGSNREWTLTRDQFYTLTQDRCHYCGAKPSKEYYHKNNSNSYIGNGIDRVDNCQGYVISNVVTCCTRCNFAKGAMMYHEFLIMIKEIYKYQYGTVVIATFAD